VHPFRFGLMASLARDPEAWVRDARRAEELAYDILLVPDHLGGQLSPVAALTAAAMATTRLRVGTFVFANDFRHPLVLAREVATLDWLSGGRFEFGIGAGWNTADYRQLGVPYPTPGRRISRLAEALPLMKRLLAGEIVDHDGVHYRMGRARVAPRPVQTPWPPVHVGGGGPRLLRLAAREADIVGFLPQFSRRGWPMVSQATEAQTARKVAIVREAAGPRFDSIELNMFVGDAGIAGSGRPLLPSLAALSKSVATRIVATPYVLYGTVAELVEQLRRRRERLGISYYAIPGHAREAMAPLVERLAGR
jgi:probable F420-dependent oxidoreductase